MHTPPEAGRSIRFWAEDDKPREKFMNKGRQSLSDAELIAILLATGSKNRTALDLARELLTLAEGQLESLCAMNIRDLSKVPGIGPAKAITIQAALELGRRSKSGKIERITIGSSRDVYEWFAPRLEDELYEQLWMLLLNGANRVIKPVQISTGGATGTVADPRKIFRLAMEEPRCAQIVLCHNHPSGQLRPSQADITLTRKVREGGKMLEISLLDHVIIGHNGYYSFADEGMME